MASKSISHFKKLSVPLLLMDGLMPVILHALLEVRMSEFFALIGSDIWKHTLICQFALLLRWITENLICIMSQWLQ